ncbi:amino acid adenylation domain-containing protein [Streptomyces sp. NBC_00536]|uniref:non-ribosomal peptide synthetase n=1 Tax=Streptomyces sp. NBC_00536 TaxID=2975769 RepID=UPI002E820CE5|nr:amino acid adenylation domain-containing protein [Streptomyces sp. NBC_00536]WUC82382.1 amino acid adenylation domain-containing protein [Streptomyces sp. NBC_00536]
MSQSPQRTALSSDKRRLLAKLLQQQGLARTAPADLIARRPEGAALPLSFAQQRLWFVEQFAGPSPLYSIACTVRLTGRLDTAALAGALGRVVARHEALRTTFRVEDGRPEQVVHAPAGVVLPLTDLSGLADDAREAALAELTEQESRRPFDLGAGPLLRAGLVKTADEEHLLLLTIHHIVADGWSLDILVRELAHHYRPDAAGPPELPELPVQYADFALWQHEKVSGDVLDGQLAHWRERLAGAPSTVDLPTDRPRTARQSFAGASFPWRLDGDLAARLTALARAHDATLYMALLAGFTAVAHRWSGQEDLVVGSPVANRNHPQTEGLIGFFVNMLPLRADLSGNPTFRELMGRIRESALSAYAHQDVPFERIVEEVRPDRDAGGRTPFANLLLVLQNTPESRIELPGLRMDVAAVDTGTAKFDLHLQVTETPQGLTGLADYSTELYEEHTVRRFIDQWLRLLDAAVTDPDTRLADLPLLTGAERRAELAAGAARHTVAAGTPSLPAAFAEQVRLRPDAIAVGCGPERLTYAELDRRSDALAHRLRALGVGPESRVAICVEPSVRLVTGILGILKSGGAYVPLDPRHPAERLAFTLADSGAVALVADPEHAGLADGITALDVDQPLTDQPLTGGPLEPAPLGPDHLAYVIYTSGTTGRPKGALLTHGNVLRLFEAAAADVSYGPDDVWSLYHSAAFDFSVWEIWGALLHGGRIAVVPQEARRTPAACHALVRAEGVTVLSQTPTAFRQFADADAAADVPGARPLALRHVVFGGEALEPGTLRDWAARHPDGPRLVNMYGITETTVHVTAHTLGPADLTASGSVIGRPLADLAVHLLDRRGEPVPPGVPGELCVAGDGLARGYLGRPGLTAERFVPSPLGDGARLYRSGDLARRLPDGTLEYLGRIDQQVKVRGHRVEIGEIEAELGAHPGVRHAAVLPLETPDGGTGLVAYLVPGEETVPAPPSDQGPARTADADAEQVDRWRTVFDTAYDQYEQVGGDDPTFNIRGWSSSYTGEPIPADEMRRWVEDTVGLVRRTGPRRILEIGSGTGLLLFRLAGACEQYTGLDLSETAVAHVRRHLPERWEHVRLLRRAGHEVDDLAGEEFDTVIVNSVAQYLPSAAYLVEVLTKAAAVLAPGGRIVVGDVRHLALLEAFQVSVLRPGLPAGAGDVELARQVRLAVRQEDELLLDPRFFEALRREIPRIGRVEVRLKPGRDTNEMTRYRYDAVLHLDTAPAPAAPVRTLAWTGGDLRSLLEQGLPDGSPLVVTGIPNARVYADARTAARLAASEAPAIEDVTALDPEELRELAAEFGLTVELSWADGDPLGRFDAAFRPAGTDPLTALPPAGDDAGLPWPHWANDPHRGRAARGLVPRLRTHLRERLPEYMVPEAFVTLDALPLTANGKLDRAALPAPDWSTGSTALLAPRDETERALAEIWSTVLGVARIGLADDFFDLGGHSLLAVQVTAAVREALGRELTVRALFEAPVLGEYAETVRRAPAAAAPDAPAAPVRESVPATDAGFDDLSAEDLAALMGGEL